MEQQTSGLVAAYRRRAFWTKTGLATATAGLAFWMTGAIAQAPASPAPDKSAGKAAQTGDGKKKSDTGKKSDGVGLKVVPMPDKQAKPDTRGQRGGKRGGSALPGADPGGPPITITPGGLPPGFPPGGGRASDITFDFHGADIDNVLKFYSQVSNLTVTKDPSLTGPVTIISPKKMSLDEAFRVLQSVLEVRGFTALQEGNVLKIVPLATGAKITSNLSTDPDNSTDPRNQIMTQVIPLENVDADAMKNELTPLINTGASLISSSGTNSLIITDTGTNVQRFIKLVDALDKSLNSSEMRYFPLKRAEASAVSDIVNNLFSKITTRGRAGAQPQPGGQPQPFPQPGGQPPPGGPAGPGRAAVVAVPDTRTNSVIVVASPDNVQKVADLISRLDDDESSTMDTRIRKIRYASAQDVASLVNTVLSNMHGGGTSGQSGNSSFQSRLFGGFNPFFGGGNNQSDQGTTSTDPFGKVVANQRTNTVLITASPDRMAKINELIDQIDVDVPTETTTFVFPLKNAQANDLATALGQAFGTGQNNNNNPFAFFGGGNNNNTTTSTRIQSLTNRKNARSLGSASTGTGRSVPPGPPNAPDGNTGNGSAAPNNGGSAMPQGVPGMMTPNGFVPMDSGNNDPNNQPTRQFFGFGFGRQQNGLGNTNGVQYGRGRGGTYSNLLQLQNNVYITPSPGGDSIIVTTTPDNYSAIKELVEALDVVPRQVMIEIIVAEVTLDQDEKLGLSIGGKLARLFSGLNTAQAQVNLPASGSGTTFDPTAGGGQFVINGTNYSSLIQAIATDNKVKVLSTPRVFGSNNQEARIEIITQVPFVNGQTASAVTTTVSNQVQYLPIGFTLDVTPRITRQGLVTIDVEQEASDLLRFDTLGTGVSAIRAPVYNDRYANTSVTIQDGETVVIGGLIRESKGLNITKVPVLSEIPLIGQFFRSREKVVNKVELMIFMTPHVINSVEEAREMTLKQGTGIIHQIPDLPKQQPNLDLKGLPQQPNAKQLNSRQSKPKSPSPTAPPMPPDSDN